MNNNKTSSLVEAGILSSIAIVFAAISLYLPVIGIFANIFWPVPLILLGVRHGLKWSVLCLISAGLLIAMIISPLQSFLLVVGLGFIGLTLGWALHSGKSPAVALALGSVASFLSKVAVLCFSFFVMGVNPVDFGPESTAKVIEEVLDFYKSVGISGDMLEKAREELKVTLSLMQIILPAGFIISSIFDTLVNFLVAKAVLKRLGTYIPDIPKFREWLMPKLLLIVYALSLLMVSYFKDTPDDIWYKVATNLNIICGLFLMIQGMAIVWHFFYQKGWPNFLKGFFVLGLFLGPIIPFATIIVGMLDFVLDFRKIRPEYQSRF